MSTIPDGKLGQHYNRHKLVMMYGCYASLTPLLKRTFPQLPREHEGVKSGVFVVTYGLAYLTTLLPFVPSLPFQQSPLYDNGRRPFRLGQIVFCDRPFFKSGLEPGRKGPAIVLGYIRGNNGQLQVILAPMTTFSNMPIESKSYIKYPQRRHHLKLPCRCFKAGDPDVLSFEKDLEYSPGKEREYSYVNCYQLSVVDRSEIKPLFRNDEPPLVLTPDSLKIVLAKNQSAGKKKIAKVENSDISPADIWALFDDQLRHDMAGKPYCLPIPPDETTDGRNCTRN